jgi:Transcriptional regulator
MDQASSRPNPADELRAVAIEQFATVGFAGTSLQQIADAAGYSKSSVLYHFASKEALLEAALNPAIDRLGDVLDGVGALSGTPARRRAFIEQFIDFLLEFRLEVHTFINQGQSLVGIPVIDRANAEVLRLAEACQTELTDTLDRVRFGVALGGAAYALVAAKNFADEEPGDDVRQALIEVVGTLLAPVRPRTARDERASRN